MDAEVAFHKVHFRTPWMEAVISPGHRIQKAIRVKTFHGVRGAVCYVVGYVVCGVARVDRVCQGFRLSELLTGD